jgi:hypothetical protein
VSRRVLRRCGDAHGGLKSCLKVYPRERQTAVAIAFAAGRRATGAPRFRLITLDPSYPEGLLDSCPGLSQCTHLQVMQPVLTRVTRFVADKRGGILPVFVTISASVISEERWKEA